MTNRDILIELMAMALHAVPDQWYRDAEARREYRRYVTEMATPEEFYGTDEEYREIDPAEYRAMYPDAYRALDEQRALLEKDASA